MISFNPQMKRWGVGLTVTGQSQPCGQWLKLLLPIWPNWVGISSLYDLLGCDTGVFGSVLLSGLQQCSAFIIKVTQYSPLEWELLAHQHSIPFCKNYSAKTF